MRSIWTVFVITFVSFSSHAETHLFTCQRTFDKSVETLTVETNWLGKATVEFARTEYAVPAWPKVVLGGMINSQTAACHCGFIGGTFPLISDTIFYSISKSYFYNDPVYGGSVVAKNLLVNSSLMSGAPKGEIVLFDTEEAAGTSVDYYECSK